MGCLPPACSWSSDNGLILCLLGIRPLKSGFVLFPFAPLHPNHRFNNDLLDGLNCFTDGETLPVQFASSDYTFYLPICKRLKADWGIYNILYPFYLVNISYYLIIMLLLIQVYICIADLSQPLISQRACRIQYGPYIGYKYSIFFGG